MKKTNKIAMFVLLAGALALPVAGCKNPAKGKAKAETGKAKSTDDKPLQGKRVETLALSSSNTKIGWKGSKVTGSHEGEFKSLRGTIEAADSDPTQARIRLTIDTGSVTSDNPKLTGHLKSKDFFWVKKHPQATFVSTSIKKGGKKGATHTITGNLTLRGVTKSIAFPANLKITDGHVHASSEFWIDRHQWGIMYAGMKDDLIRKEVVIKLDIKAPRKK